MSTVEITVSGKKFLMDENSTYEDLAKEARDLFDDDIAAARYNGKMEELSKQLKGPGQVSFITTRETQGRMIYRRSVTMLMYRAAYNVDKNVHIKVMFSLGQGYYCEIMGEKQVSEDFLKKVKAEMEKIVAEDLPIEKSSMNTKEAKQMFKELGMEHRGQLFKFRGSSKVNVYRIGHYMDYYYGYMMPSTGYLKYFDLQTYEQGFMLLFPNTDTRLVSDFNPSNKLYKTMMETNDWSEMLGIANIGDLNEAIVSGKMQDIILVQEALMEGKLSEIAERIAKDGRKFVMIAGPSSSGKTSFSHRLSIQLMAHGKHPHPIGLDNYYIDRQFCPKDENGNFDFECLEALDVEMFNRDMQRLLKGETVDMPTFNFKTGKTEYHNNFLTLGEDDVLVIEGIHGLNDKLSYTIAPEEKFKIYISALTTINVDEHNCLRTTDGRLMRRIVRDARTRGTSAQETIAMWPSVRHGEEHYIFPHQDSADVMFNSAFLYELAIIKPYVQPLLHQIEEGAPEYDEAKRLLKLLDYVLPAPSEHIKHDSLFHEFIGGSCFNV